MDILGISQETLIIGVAIGVAVIGAAVAAVVAVVEGGE